MLFSLVAILVLLAHNQIGLTDARLQRPPASVDEVYKQLLNQSYDTVYRGIARYFVNGVPPLAEKYILRQYGWTLSGNWPQAAMVRALAQQMVYEDPVCATGRTSATSRISRRRTSFTASSSGF